MFDAVIGREFADPALYRSHRLTVDAYSLQHPEEFMKSSKSAAAHLAGICWSIEVGRTRDMPRPLKAWLDGPRTFPRVTPPPVGSRGERTVPLIAAATDADSHERLAWAWAASAWAAWAEHRDQARGWVREAVAEFGRTRRG